MGRHNTARLVTTSKQALPSTSRAGRAGHPFGHLYTSHPTAGDTTPRRLLHQPPQPTSQLSSITSRSHKNL